MLARLNISMKFFPSPMLMAFPNGKILHRICRPYMLPSRDMACQKDGRLLTSLGISRQSNQLLVYCFSENSNSITVVAEYRTMVTRITSSDSRSAVVVVILDPFMMVLS